MDQAPMIHPARYEKSRLEAQLAADEAHYAKQNLLLRRIGLLIAELCASVAHLF